MTLSLANMPSSATDVSVKFLDQTKIKLRDTVTNSNGSLVSTYVYADGALDVETLIICSITADPKAGVVRNSLRLTTWEIELDADSVEIGRWPIEATIAWNVPAAGYDSSQLMSMIGTAYSLAFNGVTSKVPNTGIVEAVARALPGKLYS